MSEEQEGAKRYVEMFLKDAESRLQYQHDYTLAGLKTLILINGGAIIGLLTYAGNAGGKIAADQFAVAFGCYLAGPACSVLAYLGAYSSQGSFQHFSTLEAYRVAGIEHDGPTPAQHAKRGKVAQNLAVALTFISLIGFAAGSWSAVKAVTHVAANKCAKLQSSRQRPWEF